MWDKHRDAVEKAEAALEDKGGDLAALLASRGGVGHTKMIVLSRTGHHPKKENKPEREGEESALLLEARAAVSKSARSLCPLGMVCDRPACDWRFPAVVGVDAACFQ